MSNLWLNAIFAREPLLGYRAKILAYGVLGASFPFALLLAHDLRGADASAGQTALLAAVLGSSAALALVWRMLQPIAVAAASLRRAARGVVALPAPGREDEFDAMLADVDSLASSLDGQRHRLTNRHPISGLPTREPFLTALRENQDKESSAVLGVVRIGDYDRLAAFDHAAADAALLAFARRLEEALGPTRLLAQVDRDCFAVWLEDVDGAQSAAAELQALAFVLAQEIATDELKFTPEVALGAAVFPLDGDDPATLLTRAFAAMPKAGPSDAGKVAFFSAESSAAARARFSLEQQLRQAISREEFLLHYQPIVDLSSGTLVGAEALLRWRPPGRDLISPGEFIPVLEESGMMDEVGLWVLNTACRQARAWQEEGLGDLKMAVNLSARQFRDPALNTVILRTLERHGLATHLLELELTETATMEDAKRTRQMFGDLRDMGVSVAIDDFGTGYSSLSYLKNLPFSKLKIDREFVTDVNALRDSHAICTALIELAHGLEITVLAEGVETREELETLRLLGCSMFQGFFFARPLAAEVFATTVRDPEWLALLASPVHRERVALSRRVGA